MIGQDGWGAALGFLAGAICAGTIVWAYMHGTPNRVAMSRARNDDSRVRLLPGESNVVAVSEADGPGIRVHAGDTVVARLTYGKSSSPKRPD